MKIDEKLIEQVAKIARLDLSDKEKKGFVQDFKDILKAFSKIDEVDTKNIKPSIQPIEVKNILREDKVEKCITQEEALSNTQNKKDGYFKGPRAV